jgi:glycosyltransferase involved in cell wall biosynthesis
MHNNFRIAVIIPAYCEESRILGVLSSIPAWVDHVVVVDDASSDRTAHTASQCADPRLVVIRHPQNQGVGGATLTGFCKAMELGAQILIKMDGDGQMDPGGLAALITPIVRGQADYVKANRFLHGRELAQMPWLRRIGNIGLSFMAKLASGYWSIFDPTNGYVALHAEILPLLDNRHIHKRFFFETSLLMELGLHRAVVRDMYLPAKYGDKTSHLSERNALLEFPPLLILGFVRRIFIEYFVRDFTAVSLLLLSGWLAFLFGTIWGAYHWWVSWRTGITASTGTVMMAVLPLILGIQLLLQSLVLDIANMPSDPLWPSHSSTGSPP